VASLTRSCFWEADHAQRGRDVAQERMGDVSCCSNSKRSERVSISMRQSCCSSNSMRSSTSHSASGDLFLLFTLGRTPRLTFLDVIWTPLCPCQMIFHLFPLYKSNHLLDLFLSSPKHPIILLRTIILLQSHHFVSEESIRHAACFRITL
jgi:hypothetical protein